MEETPPPLVSNSDTQRQSSQYESLASRTRRQLADAESAEFSRPFSNVVEVVFLPQTSSPALTEELGGEEHWYRRCGRTPNAQDEVGQLFLPSILKDRIYNASVLPGLSASLIPLWRTEKTNGVLAELLMYHYRNLKVLSNYVAGLVSLRDEMPTGFPSHGPEEYNDSLRHYRMPETKKGRKTVMVVDDEGSEDFVFEYEEELEEPDELLETPTSSMPSSAVGRPTSYSATQHSEKAGSETKKSQKTDKTCFHPPLERGEEEPFGSVLLRRMYSMSFYGPFLPRCLILSLTPGLRSSVNFIHHQQRLRVEEAEREAREWNHQRHRADAGNGEGDGHLVASLRIHRGAFFPRNLLLPNPSSEFLWKMFVYLIRLRRISRHAVDAISRCLKKEARRRQRDGKDADRSRLASLVVRTVEKVQQCPYGPCPRDGRPIEPFFDDDDWRLLRGEGGVDLPPLGPPESCRVSVFDEAIDQAEGLASLAPLSDALLSEPHKLIYSLLSPLQAEAVNSTHRLCITTTALLIFMREAHMYGGGEAIHCLLRRLKLLSDSIIAENNKTEGDTTEKDGARRQCPHSHRTRAIARLIQIDPPHRTACVCRNAAPLRGMRRPTGLSHCPARQLYGTCNPENAAVRYHQRHGNCFFKNFFRLLCVWIGHYSVVQRYVVTLYFSTEVSFLDYKQISLFLLRELPHYFSDSA